MGDIPKSSFSFWVQIIIGEKWIKYHNVVRYVSSINKCIVTIENLQIYWAVLSELIAKQGPC